MGLLDGLMGSLMGGQQAGGLQQGGDNPLLQMALQMLANQNQAGGSGGLGGLINMFQNAGMGEQLKSWIGTGHNMPISADQLTAALGSDKIRDIASQLGMSHGEVSGGLADMLPQLIDRITPNGQIPDNHNMLQDALSAFLRR
ncbi:MAG: YidB family protein [Betaproteobacteria bacterium]